MKLERFGVKSVLKDYSGNGRKASATNLVELPSDASLGDRLRWLESGGRYVPAEVKSVEKAVAEGNGHLSHDEEREEGVVYQAPRVEAKSQGEEPYQRFKRLYNESKRYNETIASDLPLGEVGSYPTASKTENPTHNKSSFETREKPVEEPNERFRRLLQESEGPKEFYSFNLKSEKKANFSAPTDYITQAQAGIMSEKVEANQIEHEGLFVSVLEKVRNLKNKREVLENIYFYSGLQFIATGIVGLIPAQDWRAREGRYNKVNPGSRIDRYTSKVVVFSVGVLYLCTQLAKFLVYVMDPYRSIRNIP
jgi:hypothetical protein